MYIADSICSVSSIFTDDGKAGIILRLIGLRSVTVTHIEMTMRLL